MRCDERILERTLYPLAQNSPCPLSRPGCDFPGFWNHSTCPPLSLAPLIFLSLGVELGNYDASTVQVPPSQ